MIKTVIPPQFAQEPMGAHPSGCLADCLSQDLLDGHQRRRVMIPVDDHAVARQLRDFPFPARGIEECSFRVGRVEVVVDFELPHCVVGDRGGGGSDLRK